MNMQFIAKALLIFWGMILSVVMLKAITSVLPKNFDFLPTINFELAEDDDKKIYLPLKEKYGFTLNGIKGCNKNNQAGLYEKGYNYGTFTHCWDGSCAINISFSDKIPKNLDLYIEKNNKCQLQAINVPTTLDVLGYSLDFKLTETQKETLGIINTSKIRFKNSNGYSIDSQRQVYDYDHQREQDIMLINDKEIGVIYFTKNKHSESSDSSSDDFTSETLDVPELDVPHPKDLFTYTCNKQICEKFANTYSVNIDGGYFIPPNDFIIDCLKHPKHKYCNYMIKMGTTVSFKRPSPRLLKTLKEYAKNPEFNDKLEDWQKDKLRKSKDKILDTLM